MALDDFGSGLSSFNYLKNFVVDVIKIDGSFVRNLDKSPVDQAIVDSINQIAHRLGAVTVAEFVESREILDHLARLGWISPRATRSVGRSRSPRCSTNCAAGFVARSWAELQASAWCRYAPGVRPVHFLNARWKAEGSEKPSCSAMSWIDSSSRPRW